MIILPLDIQISDAIMNFQEQGLTVTEKVFEKCGKARHMKRSAASDPDDIIFSDNVPEEAKMTKPVFPAIPQKDLVKARKSGFEKIVADIKKVSQDSQGFWRHLPYVMCDQPDPGFKVPY